MPFASVTSSSPAPVPILPLSVDPAFAVIISFPLPVVTKPAIEAPMFKVSVLSPSPSVTFPPISLAVAVSVSSPPVRLTDPVIKESDVRLITSLESVVETVPKILPPSRVILAVASLTKRAVVPAPAPDSICPPCDIVTFAISASPMKTAGKLLVFSDRISPVFVKFITLWSSVPLSITTFCV